MGPQDTTTTATNVTDEVLATFEAAREAVHERAARRIQRGREKIRSATKTRKSTETRARIMAVAEQLMHERGGLDFKMAEVSERCGMSKGSLYYYFADKSALAEAIFSEEMEETIGAVEQIVGGAASAREALRGLCVEFARRMGAGSPLMLALVSELSSSNGEVVSQVTPHLARAIQIISAQLDAAKGEGVVRGDVDCDLAAASILGSFSMASLVHLWGGLTHDPDALAMDLVGLVLSGVGVPGAHL